MVKLKDKKGKTSKGGRESTDHEEHTEEIQEIAVETATASDNAEEQTDSSPARKRKAKEKRKAKKEKRLKASEDNDGDSSSDADSDAEVVDKATGIRPPSAKELLECEKPENILITQRQLKKEKQQKRTEEQKTQSVNKEISRNEEYLQKWKTNRKEWKFEKLRQISIQTSIFDEQKLREQIWPIALEYLSGSKGAAKEAIVKLAEEVIAKCDEQNEKVQDENEKREIFESTRYQRAREILQNFE